MVRTDSAQDAPASEYSLEWLTLPFAQPEGLVLTLDGGEVVGGAGHVLCGDSFVAQVSAVIYQRAINIE